MNLEYQHLDLLGSKLTAQMYYRDYYTRFTPFDARAVVTRAATSTVSCRTARCSAAA